MIADDYSQYTWVYFLVAEGDSFEVFESFVTTVQNELGSKIKIILGHHNGDFENKKLDELCNTLGIIH